MNLALNAFAFRDDDTARAQAAAATELVAGTPARVVREVKASLADPGSFWLEQAKRLDWIKRPEIAGDWGQFSVSTVLGDVWGRPGLEMKNRAMITIAMLTALGRLEQLRAYIVGGLNLGLTRSEVCEIIYQVAVYAGFPAAIQGFAVANDVFAEIDRASPGA